MGEYKNKIMFLGKKLNYSNEVKFRYIEILPGNRLGKEWDFYKALFRKGSIGSIYNCTFEGSTIHYNKTDIPTSLVEIGPQEFSSTFTQFPMLEQHKAESRLVEVTIKNSKKPQTKTDYEIECIRSVYKWLKPNQKAAFIADLVYKITK